jgi:hypothetical protein
MEYRVIVELQKDQCGDESYLMKLLENIRQLTIKRNRLDEPLVLAEERKSDKSSWKIKVNI